MPVQTQSATRESSVLATHGRPNPRQGVLYKSENLLRVAVVFAAIAALYAAITYARVPYQFDQAEGIVLNTGAEMARGIAPYRDPGGFPVTFNPYGPVFYALIATAVKLAGVGFTVPRLMVFAATLITALLLVGLLRRWTGSRSLAMTFGFLYLGSQIVQAWSTIVRVDPFAVMFTVGGLYLFAAFSQRWYWSVPLFVAALFAKLTMIAAPAACLAFLIAQRNWKKAGAFAASAAVLGLAALAAAEWWSSGWFFFHTFRTHPDAYRAAWLVDLLGRVLRTELVALALAVPFVIRQLTRRDHPKSLAALYFVFALATSVSAGKLGANSNYFLELIAATCLCAGLAFQEWRERHPLPLAVAAIALAAVVIAGAVMRIAPGFNAQHHAVAGCSAAYAYVAQHPGRRVLSENVGALIVAGKPVLLNDPFMYEQMIEAGRASDEPMVRRVASRDFDVIMLGGNMEFYHQNRSARWSPPFLAAVERNYRETRSFDCLDAAVAFEPK